MRVTLDEKSWMQTAAELGIGNWLAGLKIADTLSTSGGNMEILAKKRHFM